MGSSSSESEAERRHKKSSGKKTKKRYRNKSDDDEKGYKKFKRKKEKKSKSKKKRDNSRSDSEAPSLTSYEIPKPEISTGRVQEESPVDSYGPALPPHLKPAAERKFGPQLPSSIEDLQPIEPAAAPLDDDEDEELDDECVGPLPGISNEKLEERALEIKLGRLATSSTDTSGGRESWMLELPRVKSVAELGMGQARQFRTRDRPDFSDRSEWTDTPSEREKKKADGGSKPTPVDKKLEFERRLAAKRDAEQEQVAKAFKKKRDKSLMELHDAKVKKAKKEKEEEPQVRRPFDRNVDLAANRFDDAQKKAIVKKAQLLDTRFSSGASKYL